VENRDVSIQTAIDKAGTAKALADLLGVTSQVVSNWKTRGVPPEQCKAIEAATGVSVKDLRPDDWSRYWPEAA
jgi:DNA-binding transcriptional regulator YdaS (Cro superfamily)